MLCHNPYCIPSQSQTIFQIGAEEDLLDSNDLNQVVAFSGFRENKGLVWVECSAVSRAHKTWSRSFLLKDFLAKQVEASKVAVMYTSKMEFRTLSECETGGVSYFR